jgi:hypothetical protein
MFELMIQLSNVLRNQQNAFICLILHSMLTDFLPLFRVASTRFYFIALDFIRSILHGKELCKGILQGSVHRTMQGSVHRIMQGSVHRIMQGSVHRTMQGSVHRIMQRSVYKILQGSVHREGKLPVSHYQR